MKKSQIAFEFLITYGWAILGVLIIVAALSYFGFFNTTRYVDDACNFGEQFKCEDFIARQDGWISLRLRNNFGVPISLGQVEVKSDYGTSTCIPAYMFLNPASASEVQYTIPLYIEAGQLIEINCNVQPSLPHNLISSIDDKLSFKTTVEFRRYSSIPPLNALHNITGTVLVKLQPVGKCNNGVRDCYGDECETEVDCSTTCSNPSC